MELKKLRLSIQVGLTRQMQVENETQVFCDDDGRKLWQRER